MQVDFYHLTTMPLDRVLPRIAERVLEGGGRLVVVSADERQRSALDRLLWTYSADSFLPHALAGGDADHRQPVLIAGDLAAPNQARHAAIVDGEWRDAALAFDRAFHFFDEEWIAAARIAWQTLADRPDAERRYWKQNDAGRWERLA
ncbi:DNA polymerase III subunit chi [uncultured Sphingomonas sp.]|uniref:DNA polymerase III subunit chi n=1 Tax=uncultured Sphingomonas sp. TaxID=158754 RepID=UPI0035CA9BF8